MGQISTITKLPKALQAQIGRLHGEGVSNQQIAAHLRALGQSKVSTSAVQRWVQNLKRVGGLLQKSREVAEGLMSKLGEDGEGKLLRLNVELLQEMSLRILVGKDGETVTLSPKEAMLLSATLQNLARASKTDADLHAQIKKQALVEVGIKIKEQGAKEGLSPEAIAAVNTLLKGV